MTFRKLSQPDLPSHPSTAFVPWRRRVSATVIGCAALLAGCSKFHPHPADKYVYVTAKQTYLRDRVAAVSNRTGNVTNGERLTVLDRSRRFVKVRTPQNEEGWIDEKAVATQETFDQFDAMGATHAKDPVVGQATVRDEVYLHIAPGRDTDRFFRLNEGDKLQLLGRATLPKVAPGTARPAPGPKPAAPAKPGPTKPAPLPGKGPLVAKTDAPPEPPPPPVMEDWWLVRDAQKHTGWLYSRMMDVEAPDALVRYAEGQRIVGSYVLTTVNDPGSGQLRDGKPDPEIPVYVTVVSPYKAGLPYDFDQVRVFSWNLKKHRYETAFRDRNIAGYLPVTIQQMKDPYSKAPNASTPLPAFTYRVLAAESPIPTPDPVTGRVTPGKLVEKTYRLEGNITRRILPPGTQGPEVAHPIPESDKKDKKKHKK